VPGVAGLGLRLFGGWAIHAVQKEGSAITDKFATAMVDMASELAAVVDREEVEVLGHLVIHMYKLIS
jgi:hypothetical protein